ncbi:MAG: YraN family protein [Eubacteriaceae bacterium]
MSKKNNYLKGKKGEDLSVVYLKKRKYKIRDINYRCPLGEIDIIARQKDTIVFIEVKTRTSIQYGYPREAVNYYKQKKISQAALYYLKKYDLFENNVRFDVIDILVDTINTKITHIINAFEIIMK